MGDTEDLKKEIAALRKRLLELKRDLLKDLEEAIKSAEASVEADKKLIEKKLMAPNGSDLAKDQETVARLKKQRLDVSEDLLKELLEEQEGGGGKDKKK